MEFALRRIKKADLSETNEVLGKGYEVYNRRTAPEKVEGLWVLSQGDKSMPQGLFGMLVYGAEIVPLYTDSFYYVMQNNGSTFDRLTP